MLNALAFSQTTNIDEVTKKNFLCLAVLNSTFLNNLLIYGQPNAKVFWTLMRTPGLVLVFANY